MRVDAQPQLRSLTSARLIPDLTMQHIFATKCDCQSFEFVLSSPIFAFFFAFFFCISCNTGKVIHSRIFFSFFSTHMHCKCVRYLQATAH